MSPTRLANLWMIAALVAACSFDASNLRRSAAPADGAADPPVPPYPDTPSGNDDTASLPDTPEGTPDAPGGLGGGGAPPSTGGVGGSGGPTDSAVTEDVYVPIETGGTDNGDGPIATGGTGAGGSEGFGGTTGTTGGADAAAGSGGASGGSTVIGGGGAGTDGSAGSGGQTNAGGSDGGGADGARDAASSSGGRGGQAASGGQGASGGSSGGGSGGSSDAGNSDGRTCGQCPPTATIGITGPWGATFSNGSSGTVVTTGDAVFLNWLATRGTSCVAQNLDISGNNYLTAARLAPYQVIVVLDIYHTQADKNAFFNAKLTNPGFPAYPGTQRTLLASEVTAVKDWVNGGGGLMTTIGTASVAAEMTNANLLLNPFGIAYSVTDVNVLLGNSSVTAFATAAPIASQLTAGVTTLRVTGAVVIEGLAGGNLPPNSSTFSLYATSSYYSRAGSGTYDLGVAKIANGSGRINVWCDEMITYDIAWNTSTIQTQTYWTNVLNWLGQCP